MLTESRQDFFNHATCDQAVTTKIYLNGLYLLRRPDPLVDLLVRMCMNHPRQTCVRDPLSCPTRSKVKQNVSFISRTRVK